jgi:geranylgeranyl pyrophosphate synthase/predicted secreted hydrolase
MIRASRYPSRQHSNFTLKLTDESPHYESPFEWWFVHGHFTGAFLPHQYFMISFFRHEVPQKSTAFRPAFSFLSSVFDTTTNGQKAESWISYSLFNSIVKTPKQIFPLNIDPHLIDLYANETRNHGTFRGLEVLRSKPKFGFSPFKVEWNGFSLRQDSGSFLLCFLNPITRKECKFMLQPLTPRWEVEAARYPSRPTLSMEYFSFPRLRLKGNMGKTAVVGRAWLDHQWGEYGWLISKPPCPRALGWNWFGLNLDDGTDIIIMVHRDAQTKKKIAQFAVLRDRRNHVRQTSRLQMKALKIWESPKSAIRYPVAWRMEIPEFQADLIFSPLSNSQEIPVFGPARAIWEGAGRVSGVIGGRKVQGTARGEFQGYGYIYDFSDIMRTFSDRVDRHIEGFLPRKITEQKLRKYVGLPKWKHTPSAYTTMLSRPVWDLISRGGKRWRPLFALLLLEALGRDPAPFESMICVLAELCHTGALIIDDIEDASLFRRGDPCLHLRYGQDVAINAANTLYFLPSLQIFNHPLLTAKQRLEIHEVMTRQYIRAHFGQALDLFWSRHMSEKNLRHWMSDSLGPKILQMYEFKTGALVEALAETATIVAKTPPTLKNESVRFASALGVAFQIVDDVHNFTDGLRTKKVLGEDLSEGKLTYVLFRALKSLRPCERKRLQKIMTSKPLRQDPSSHLEGIELIRKSGAMDLCRKEAEQLARSAWDKLARVLPPSESKILLKTLYLCLLDLSFDIKI